MKCDCTIPIAFGGEEECTNDVVWRVVLTSEFGGEVCYWCDECVKAGIDMIDSLSRKEC